jgi:hypothetical protein
MNNITDYINYGYSDDNDRDSNDNYSSDNDDNNNDDSNDEGELFWKMKFDCHKMVLCMAGALVLYYNTYYMDIGHNV